jgi:hypothetical protein
VTKILELKLETSSLRQTGYTLIIPIWDTFPCSEVDARPRDTRGRVECAKKPITEIDRSIEVELGVCLDFWKGVCGRQVMC